MFIFTQLSFIEVFHLNKYMWCIYVRTRTWKKRESIGVRVFSSNSHKLERTIKATDICVRKGWSQPPPFALLFQGSRRKSKEMQFSLFHFSEEEAAQRVPVSVSRILRWARGSWRRK